MSALLEQHRPQAPTPRPVLVPVLLQEQLLAPRWTGEILLIERIPFVISVWGATEPGALLLLASGSSSFYPLRCTCREACRIFVHLSDAAFLRGTA